MDDKSKSLKRIAGLTWLLAALLVTLATTSAQARMGVTVGTPIRGGTEAARMGVTVGAPIRGGNEGFRMGATVGAPIRPGG